MQKNSKQLISIFSIALGLLIAISPFSVSYAQKKPKTQSAKIQTEQEIEARREVAKSVIANAFFDSLTTKEPKWKLKKASSSLGGVDGNRIKNQLSFKKGSDEIHINILEFKSAKDAAEMFTIPRSMGESVEFSTYGDQGEKIFIYGNFVLLNLRIGNVFIVIGGTDEKTAVRFAGHVAESISSLTHK